MGVKAFVIHAITKKQGAGMPKCNRNTSKKRELLRVETEIAGKNYRWAIAHYYWLAADAFIWSNILLKPSAL
jgi:hypothetical protein